MAAFPYEITSSRAAVRSARVRPAYELHRGFDASPAFCIFGLTFLFAGASLFSDLGNGPITMGFQQLPRVIMHVDFSHPHGVILLSLHATGHSQTRTRRSVLTPFHVSTLRSESPADAQSRAASGPAP